MQEPPCQAENYMQSDPVTGNFGAFEIGSDIENLSLSNVRATLNKKEYPMCRLLSVGPKSARYGDTECFDPYVRCHIEKLWLENIRINGEIPADWAQWIQEVNFKELYADEPSSGNGTIKKIFL